MLCVLPRILYPSIGGAPAYRACCSCITESFDDARCTFETITSPVFNGDNVNFTMRALNRDSEQSQSAGRRYGVSARLHGELDEDAFDVGLHGLGGNLQLLGDAFVGKSAAHRAQDAVFARTQRLRDARGTSRGACTLLSTVRENAFDADNPAATRDLVAPP